MSLKLKSPYEKIGEEIPYNESSSPFPESIDPAEIKEWLEDELNNPQSLKGHFPIDNNGISESAVSSIEVLECYIIVSRLFLKLKIRIKNLEGNSVSDDNCLVMAIVKVDLYYQTEQDRWGLPPGSRTGDIIIEIDGARFNDINNLRMKLSHRYIYLTNFNALKFLISEIGLEMFLLAKNPYSDFEKDTNNILILGLPGNGKSTLTNALRTKGYFALPEGFDKVDEMTGVDTHTNARSASDKFRNPAIYLPDNILNLIRLLIQSANNRMERLKSKTVVTRFHNLIAQGLGEVDVHNGSLIQSLLSSLAYYKLVPFKEDDYYCTDQARLAEMLALLKNPSTDVENELIELADLSGLIMAIKQAFKIIGNPSVIIMNEVDELIRQKILANQPEDDQIRRFWALKYEPWLKIWYEAFRIIILKRFPQVEILSYDFTKDLEASQLITKLNQLIPPTQTNVDAISLMSMIRMNPRSILFLPVLGRDKLFVLLTKLKELGYFNDFLKIFNIFAKQCNIEPFDYNLGIKPAINSNQSDLIALNQLFTILIQHKESLVTEGNAVKVNNA